MITGFGSIRLILILCSRTKLEDARPGTPLGLEMTIFKSVSLVTEDVVLVGLEPFIEEQVLGLESFRKFGIETSMTFTSLQLSL